MRIKIKLYDVSNDVGSQTNTYIASSNDGDMILKPETGKLVLITDGEGIGSSTYVSGFAGSGWKIWQDANNNYNLEADNLTVRGTMSVYELLIQQIRATNGSIIVGSADRVEDITLISGTSYKFTIQADSSTDFIHFTEGDLILAQKWQGTSGDPPYTPNLIIKATVTETSNSAGSTLSAKEFKADISDGQTVIDSVPLDFVRVGNTTDTDRQGVFI